MTKPIEVSHQNFERFITKLKEDHPPSVFLLRRRMKEKLGFTWRDHTDWNQHESRYNKKCIMLDFYSEKKRTFLIMKYSEYFLGGDT